jgi:hypothetical protein
MVCTITGFATISSSTDTHGGASSLAESAAHLADSCGVAVADWSCQGSGSGPVAGGGSAAAFGCSTGDSGSGGTAVVVGWFFAGVGEGVVLTPDVLAAVQSPEQVAGMDTTDAAAPAALAPAPQQQVRVIVCVPAFVCAPRRRGRVV